MQNIDRDIDVFIQQLVNRNVNCYLCSFSNRFVYRTEIEKWSKMAWLVTIAVFLPFWCGLLGQQE